MRAPGHLSVKKLDVKNNKIPYAVLKDFFEKKFENNIVKAFLSDEKRKELKNLDGDDDGLVKYGDFLHFLGFWDAVHTPAGSTQNINKT